jgi:Flp pilus assembly pilin Flp
MDSIEIMNDELQNEMARKVKRDKGVTTVEYAIMLALVAIAVAIASPNISSAVITVFQHASSVMK